MPRTLKLTIAYDGTRFVGWQRQSEGESIQGLLETALARFEGAPVVVHGAGRTDAGVHALAQAASVTLSGAHPLDAIVRALNAQLPRDVRVLDAVEAPPEFHARFDARGKAYRYLIRTGAIASPFDRGYVWHVPETLDLDRMRSAARLLVGTHDFAAFQSAGSHTRSSHRTITASDVSVVPAPMFNSIDSAAIAPLLSYEVHGDGFLRHMVRAITGTLVDIGRGWRPDTIADLLRGGVRAAAGPTAPAHGLYLVRVDYDWH